MSPRRIAALAAVVAALGAAVAIARPNALRPQPPAPAPLAQPERGEPNWLQDLNLSPEQVQKIQSIRHRRKEKMMQQRQAMRQAQQGLRELMAGNASDDQIRQKYRQVRDLRRQFGDAQFNSMLEMRKILTPDQRRKFVDRMQKPPGNFKNHPKERF